MSVTAVPLRPIAKNSLTKLWVGVAALALAGAGLSYVTHASVGALEFEVVKEGTGPSPTAADVVLVSYIGKLEDGKVFDQNPQAAFPVEGVVPGFGQALQRMKKGGHYHVVIPPSLGYGDKAVGPIPANSTLIFDVELIDFKSQAEIQQMQREMQQMQMQGGAPHGAMPGQ